MDHPCGPPLIFEDEFYRRSKPILGTLNGALFLRVIAPHTLHQEGSFILSYLHLFNFFLQFHAKVMGSF